MASASLAYIPHLPPKVVALEAVPHTLPTDSQLVLHRMAIALAYFPHRIQLWVVACQKRIRMLHFS